MGKNMAINCFELILGVTILIKGVFDVIYWTFKGVLIAIVCFDFLNLLSSSFYDIVVPQELANQVFTLSAVLNLFRLSFD